MSKNALSTKGDIYQHLFICCNKYFYPKNRLDTTLHRLDKTLPNKGVVIRSKHCLNIKSQIKWITELEHS